MFYQLRDDVIPLGIGVGVGGMSDLEREPGQGETGILGAGSDPIDACGFRRPVGVEPEARGAQRLVRARDAQCPEPDVMALARTVIDRLLEADVLAAPEQIEGTERSGRARRG